MLVAAVLLALNIAFAIRSVAIALRSAQFVAGETAGEQPGFVSIVVPARNEAHQIARCVRSLLDQRAIAFEVIVVDDRSEDGTAAIVAQIAREDGRLQLIHGAPLPAGWVGKPWALEQGALHARGDWLIFTDADTEHEPFAAASAVCYARTNGLDALSLLTEQRIVSVAERLTLPSILWTIAFATGSLAAVNDPNDRAALFNGQFILFSAATYRRIGGHAAVRSEIAEDLELSRLLKADPECRAALVNGTSLVRTRMYRSFREVWNGFVKNFALGARGRPAAAIAGGVFFVAIAPVTPLAAIAAVGSHAWAVATTLCAAVAIAMAGADFGMRRFGMPAGSGIFLPIGITVMNAIYFTSAVRHARGGVSWRGRRYGGNRAGSGG